MEQTLTAYAPQIRSILRIVAALLFLEHGTSGLFGWPSPLPTPPLFSLYWFSGSIELVGGVLLALGLFSRPAAFVMSGEMAFAYFIGHAPRDFSRSSTAAMRRFCSALCFCIWCSRGRARGVWTRSGGRRA